MVRLSQKITSSYPFQILMTAHQILVTTVELAWMELMLTLVYVQMDFTPGTIVVSCFNQFFEIQN